jgi:hypothetical protein
MKSQYLVSVLAAMLVLPSCGLLGPKAPEWSTNLARLKQTATLINTTTGAAATVNVTVDTGSDRMILMSPELAEQLGLGSASETWELRTVAGGTPITLRGIGGSVLFDNVPPNGERFDQDTVLIGLDALRALACSPAYTRAEGLRLLPNADIQQLADLQDYTPIPLQNSPVSWVKNSPIFANDRELYRWGKARGLTSEQIDKTKLRTLNGVQAIFGVRIDGLTLPFILATVNAERSTFVLDTGTDLDLVLFIPPESIDAPTTKLPTPRGPIPYSLHYAGQAHVYFDQGLAGLAHVVLAVPPSNVELIDPSSDVKNRPPFDGLIGLPLMNRMDWVLDLERRIWFVRPPTPKPGPEPAP